MLGCGATLAQLADDGTETHVLVLARGVSTDARNGVAEAESRTRAESLHAAARVLGATAWHHDLPDQRFDSLDQLDVVKIVESRKRAIQPDLVFTHHPGDLNTDHQITTNAVLAAFRPQPGEKAVTILGFETVSSTEWNVPSNGTVFAPNWYEDATLGLDRKLEAMGHYADELRDWPHPRSLEGIATQARRHGMNVGLQAAEAFMLLRHIHKQGAV